MIITTKSSKLAAYAQGNPGADKLAIVLPGFLDTKDHPHMQSHVDFLSEQGFYAISFDPPGTWGSSGDIASYTMTNWLQAIEEIIGYFNNRPTFTMGTSRGGSMAMLAAIRNQSVFAFASVMSKASYAPSADTVHPMNEWKAAGTHEFHVTIPGQPGHKRTFIVPYSVVEDTQRYNMVDDLLILQKPKLFIAGTQDVTVKPEVVKAAYNVAADPKQFAEVDSDHLYRRRPEIIQEINRLVGQFLEKLA